MPSVPITVEDAENLTQAHNCRLGDEISFAKNLRTKESCLSIFIYTYKMF